MDFNIKDVNETEKEIEINLVASELEPHFEKAYKNYQKKIEIDGFRKGKAPMHMIKKLYGESIEYEALEKIADDAFKKAVEQNQIDPIGTPALIDMDYKRGESAGFKIKYEIKPEFELKEYKGLSFEKLIRTVNEEEIENEIKRILFANSKLEEAQKVTDENYIVTYDVQDLDENGVPMIGKSSKGERMYLGEKFYLPEFKEAFLSVAVGDAPIVDFEIDHDGHKHKHKTQLTVTKIEKVNLPELDDEFVKKITKEKVNTVEEFKAHLAKDIESYYDNQSEKKLMDDIIEKIMSQYNFTVPPSMVDAILDSYIESMKDKYPKRELPSDFNEEKYKENSRADAAWQAKWYLISDKILKTENLVLEDSEIEALVDKDVERTGIDRERLLEYYKKSPALKEKLLSEKLRQFLRSNNTITEKVLEEK